MDLAGEVGFEFGAALGDGLLVAGGIDEDGGAFGLHARDFVEQAEVFAVGTEEDVAGKGFELGEGVGEVLRDAGVGGGMAWRGDETVLAECGHAADDDYVEGLIVFDDLRGPGGAAGGVARGFVRS